KVKTIFKKSFSSKCFNLGNLLTASNYVNKINFNLQVFFQKKNLGPCFISFLVFYFKLLLSVNLKHHYSFSNFSISSSSFSFSSSVITGNSGFNSSNT